MPKVSVIIPTYNRQDKIVSSINSVLKQTYKDFEVLIIDDGSTDDTEMQVTAIADERIRYIKLEVNMGASRARNEGVREARGELIAFQDSDDLWQADKLEKQLKYMEMHPEYSLVYCAYTYHREGKEWRVPYKDSESYEGDIFQTLLLKNVVGTPTMLMKKECFLEVGGFNTALRCLEDWEFILRFAEKYLIGYIGETLLDAFYSQGSVSANALGHCETRCYIIANYKDYLVKNNLFDKVVGNFFNDAANAGILDKVKDMLKAFIVASEGMER